MGVVNDKLFLDISDIMNCCNALDLVARSNRSLGDFKGNIDLAKSYEETSKKIKQVYSELFQNNDNRE